MMSSKLRSDQIRKDQSLKSNTKLSKNIDTISNSSENKTIETSKKSIQKSSNNEKSYQTKRHSCINDKNKNESNIESRDSLQQKIKYLEEQLEK